MAILTSSEPYAQDRDKLEEEELWKLQRNEPFPSSMGGFKNHPKCVSSLSPVPFLAR